MSRLSNVRAFDFLAFLGSTRTLLFAAIFLPERLLFQNGKATREQTARTVPELPPWLLAAASGKRATDSLPFWWRIRRRVRHLFGVDRAVSLEVVDELVGWP